MEHILCTNNLTKRFGAVEAVSQVSISVPERSIYGLLGPNGAGKSTLLKMICGIARPTSGDMFICGKPWNRAALAHVGSLIENAPLYPNLTARENCRVRTLALGLPDSCIDEALTTVGLTDTGRKCARHFSLGMKQRLGVALALLGRPELLILDEPTNGLDPIAIKEMRSLLRDLVDAGTTVVISSHILAEVEQVADCVGIMAHGCLGFEGAIPNGRLEDLFTEVVEGIQARDRGGRYV